MNTPTPAQRVILERMAGGAALYWDGPRQRYYLDAEPVNTNTVRGAVWRGLLAGSTTGPVHVTDKGRAALARAGRVEGEQ